MRLILCVIKKLQRRPRPDLGCRALGWMDGGYVSELRPPTSLLFIPRVICEHGEPRWWSWCQLGITPDSVRFQVLTAASMKFIFVFWDVLPCKIIVDRLFRGTCCLHHQGDRLIMEAAHASETSVYNYFHGSTSQKTNLNSWLVHQTFWQSYHKRHLGKVGGMDKGVRTLPISIWNNSRDILHTVKSYDMGPSLFTSHPKEGVLRIFIALKNPSPWPGFNPLHLGPVASTLNTTPPRWHTPWYSGCQETAIL
jgi:hypothetical protein